MDGLENFYDGMVCVVGKNHIFQPQVFGFDPWLCKDLKYLCELFSTKTHSIFHPYRVGNQSISFCWELIYEGVVTHTG